MLITLEHNGIKLKCRPERVSQYRQAIDKPQKLKAVPERRSYPQWMVGMTTGDYIQAYRRLNDGKRMIECNHVCANLWSVPTMYDSALPEVLEEIDPDYVETVKAKPKAVTSAQLKQALKSLIDAIFEGDPQTIGDEAIRAKGLLK